MLYFEVYRTRGSNRWEYLGEYLAPDSFVAARLASKAHKVNLIATRPSGADVRLTVYRLGNEPERRKDRKRAFSGRKA